MDKTYGRSVPPTYHHGSASRPIAVRSDFRHRQSQINYRPYKRKSELSRKTTLCVCYGPHNKSSYMKSWS